VAEHSCRSAALPKTTAASVGGPVCMCYTASGQGQQRNSIRKYMGLHYQVTCMACALCMLGARVVPSALHSSCRHRSGKGGGAAAAGSAFCWWCSVYPGSRAGRLAWWALLFLVAAGGYMVWPPPPAAELGAAQEHAVCAGRLLQVLACSVSGGGRQLIDWTVVQHIVQQGVCSATLASCKECTG
jgi:hypothetical protein